MNQLNTKIVNYPDWDRVEQIEKNRLALEILEQRRKKRSQITKEEEREKTEFFEDFKQLIDEFRPCGAKLYSEL